MKKLIPICLTLTLTLQCLAQSKPGDKKITIHYTSLSFETLISRLRKDHEINIVYSIDKLKPSHRRITINMANATIKELMTFISNYYNLRFDCVGNYVMINQSERKPEHETKSLPVELPMTLKVQPVTNSLDSSMLQIVSVVKAVDKDSVVFVDIQPMIARDSLLVKPMLSTPLRKQQIVHQIMAAFASADFHQYHFTPLADKHQDYSIPITFSASLAYSRSVTPKLYGGLRLTYSGKEFTYNRNFKMLMMDDPVSIPNRTKVSMRYLEIPIELAYRLDKGKHTSVQITSGISSAILISKTEKTQYLTQGNPNTKYFVNGSRSFLFSALLGVRYSVQLVRTLGLFCEPQYQKYFHKVNSQVMDTGADLFRINSGVFMRL